MKSIQKQDEDLIHKCFTWGYIYLQVKNKESLRFHKDLIRCMDEYQILIIIVVLVLIGIPSAFANDYDVSLIDVEIVDLQIISLDDTPGYYQDNSNLIKITLNVTNNGLDYFLVSDKLFKIWVMEPNFRKSTADNTVFEIADNYYTFYDDELEVRYDDLPSRELFEECDYIHDRVFIGESKVFTICFDVLKIWNNDFPNLDGSKKNYLVMMANHQSTTCPNCKKLLLSTPEVDQKMHFPNWVRNLVNWHNQGIISEQEYQNSIEYLVVKGIISKVADEVNSMMSLTSKNQQLKEHQARLSLALQPNLNVSAMNFYESKFADDVFSGIICKKQNNIVTLSGDYTNDDYFYQAVFFKLLLFDDSGNVVNIGMAKIVDVVPEDLRHFSVSVSHKDKINSCMIMVDSKFKK